jgi:hypothetical protein
LKLEYKITSSTDAEPVMIGFNDNLTAAGIYNVVAVGTWSGVAGKIHAGFARTAAGSSGQMNSFEIRPSGNLVMVAGDHLSESNFAYWASIFKSYLKYGTPQTITKINMKCNNAGTTITSIYWKIVALP